MNPVNEGLTVTMLAFNSLGKNLPSVKTSEAQMVVRALPVYEGPKELTLSFTQLES
jgi:hypothetical protein